jgi:hypothetical protein
MTSIKVRNGNNVNMDFSATNSPKLRCIEVDNVAYAEQYFAKDDTAWFSENCGNAGGEVVYFADPNLKSFLVSLPDVNTNHDSEIQVSEAEYGGTFGSTWNTLVIENKNISDATGMEAFKNIRFLFMANNQLTTIDVRQNTGLWGLDVSKNNITSIQFGSTLGQLTCINNQLTTLDLSNADALVSLDYSNNPMEPLDLSMLPQLTDLGCSGTGLTSLDLSGNQNLFTLSCENNELTSLDLSGLTRLGTLAVSGNQLSSLNLSNNLGLHSLSCSDNPLASLNVNHLTELYAITVNNTPITSLDLSNMPQLEEVNVASNQLTQLNVSDSYMVTYLYAGFNQLTTFVPFGVLDVLELNNNALNSLDLGGYEGKEYYSWNMHNNPDLHCVGVDDEQFANDYWTSFFDEGVSFSTDCGSTDPGGRMSISTYPNPVVDKVNIESTEPVDLVQVFDSTGGLLIDTQKGNTIDFSSFRRGVYLMHVYSGGKRTPVRVVKE